MNKTAVTLLLSILAPVAFGQSSVVSERFEPSTLRTRTAEDYATASPRPLPRVSLDLLAAPRLAPGVATSRGALDEEPLIEARPPGISIRERRALRRVLFDDSSEELRALWSAADGSERSAINPRTYGVAELDYTSSRLTPPSAAELYPYSAVGKLFFTDGGDDFVCSGAVIAPRLVITAAHCVHGGRGVGFYENFEFVPAYRDGNAPFGTWLADGGFVTISWVESPEVPSSQDFAILQFRDQLGVSLADATGQLTYFLFHLADNHLHLLGYSGNLDQGAQMHQVTSGDFWDLSDGTVAYGSDMGGGSNGGPWVQNFGNFARGQTRGLNPRPRAVVGVTSFGFDVQSIAAQGAAMLNGDFQRLIRFVCDFQPGNC